MFLICLVLILIFNCSFPLVRLIASASAAASQSINPHTILAYAGDCHAFYLSLVPIPFICLLLISLSFSLSLFLCLPPLLFPFAVPSTAAN